MKGKQIGAAVLLTALLLLSACGGEEEADAPHYTVAGMEFPALPTEEEPETEIYGTGDAVTRTYTQFSDPKQVVSDYVALMTGEQGFQVVTETLLPQSPPSEYGAEGEIYLGRVTEEGDKTVLFELAWSPESCIVISSLIPAPIPENTIEVMGVTETLTYMESLSPSDLGLEGDSMDAYEVYAQDSVVMVNGLRCMQLDVYSQGGEQGGNALEGSFLMSFSGQLYRLDRTTNEIQCLDGLNPNLGTETEEPDQAGKDGDNQTEPQDQPEEEEKTESPQSRMAVAE